MQAFTDYRVVNRGWWLSVLVAGLVLASSSAWSAYQHAALDQQWQQALAAAPTSVAGQYPYQACFQQAAQRYTLPLSLLLAVARGESNFNPQVVSKANAIGVMQIQWPGTAQHLGIDDRNLLYDACINIDAGARYLRQLIDQFGSVHTALAAYNYGPSRIRRAGDQIPQGALWYSSYIYDHWQTLQGRRTEQDFSQTQIVELIRFREPFRAQGFVRNLQQQLPSINFQWFKRGDTQFSVVAEFASRAQANAAAENLRKLGFKLAI